MADQFTPLIYASFIPAIAFAPTRRYNPSKGKVLVIYIGKSSARMHLAKNSIKSPFQTLTFDQRSLLSAAFLESVLALLCHAFACLSFSSISSHMPPTLRLQRLFSSLREVQDDPQQDQKSSSSRSDRSGVASRCDDGALGGTFSCASGLALAQSTVQLAVDMCSKQTGRLDGLRASCREAEAALGSITWCRGIGDDVLFALFGVVGLRDLASLILEYFSFTTSCGKSTKSSGASGEPDWWIMTFFKCLLFLALTDCVNGICLMDAFSLMVGVVDDMIGVDEMGGWGMR